MAKCPECGSTKTIKRGKTVTKQGKFQRYFCNNCGNWWTSDEPFIKKAWLPITYMPKSESPEKLRLKQKRREK
jgi:uncharacterized Zn finger protein